MVESTDRLSVFPAFVKVEGKRVLVYGNGNEAFAKTRLLRNTHADIHVYAPVPIDAFARYLHQEDIRHFRQEFDAAQIDGATLVFAATGDATIDRRIIAAARGKNVPANAVDQPDYCDFYTPALVNRSPVAVAIGTEGAGPVLGQMIRARIDRILPPHLGQLARLAAGYREAAEAALPRGAARRSFWRRFFSGRTAQALGRGEPAAARREAAKLLHDPEAVEGHVWLVGAGPGAEDLLTLRAQRVLMNADVIVHDALVPPAVVDIGRRDAERIVVGKRKGRHSISQREINTLLVELASAGRQVVRLKSGDSLIFGRAGEEMAALREAGISYEIVPGITSALAAAADFELPLTLRGVASSMIFTTGHDLRGAVLPDWAQLAVSGATIAVYMGLTVAADVARRLIEAGMTSGTGVAVVENASRTDCRMLHGTLAQLPLIERCDELTGPVMVIIGDAVASANFDRSIPLAAHIRALEAA